MSGPDPGQGLLHPLFHLIPGQAQIQRAKGHIVKHRRHEELVVRVLEHHAHRAPDLRQSGGGQGKIPDADRPLAGCQIPVQMQEQGGLARPVGADDRHRLAMGDPEGNTPQRFGAIGIDMTQILDLDNMMAHPLPPVTIVPRS